MLRSARLNRKVIKLKKAPGMALAVETAFRAMRTALPT
jgi:hypothetical protein